MAQGAWRPPSSTSLGIPLFAVRNGTVWDMRRATRRDSIIRIDAGDRCYVKRDNQADEPKGQRGEEKQRTAENTFAKKPNESANNCGENEQEPETKKPGSKDADDEKPPSAGKQPF
jgi:hypothetical protein